MKIKLIKFCVYFFSISGFVVLTYVGSMLIYNILIPDPCKYHAVDDADIPLFFKIFYPQTGANGYHTEPGLFHLIFFAVIGVLLGIIVSRLLINVIFKKRNKAVSGVLDKFE